MRLVGQLAQVFEPYRLIFSEIFFCGGWGEKRSIPHHNISERH